MATKTQRPSPILGAASMMISEASDTLVTSDSRFHHSFEVALDAIEPDPEQARKQHAPDDIAALAGTMAAEGQLQPILLRRHPSERGRWVIVAGERRWRAAQLNGWPTILAIEHDKDPEIASLVENLQRVDLNAVEEATGVRRLIESKQWTQDQAAGVLGKPKSEVSALLRILSLPSDLLESVLTSELSIPRNVLVELARVDDMMIREPLLQLAREGALTVKMIRSAREDGGANFSSRGERPSDRKSASAPLVQVSFRAVETMAGRLRAARESGKPIGEKGREALLQLRQAIDDLLANSSIRPQAE
ncbi:MAG: ParB/RepB/Spo0J family partition protein [Rhodospirillales bacterium]|nr:ParB/RepB/Spo0J family partition protein [Rhodospirillales bacterium]